MGARRKKVNGHPDGRHVSTGHVERHNLTVRMSMRRFTRLTNAFSKKIDNHIHALSLYFVYYNFCRIHKSLKVTPAMAAGLTDKLYNIGFIVDLEPHPRSSPARSPEQNMQSVKSQTETLPSMSISLP